MKKLIFTLATGLLLTSTAPFQTNLLNAVIDVDIEDLSTVDIDEDDTGGPFSIGISGDAIDKARFEKHKQYGHLYFATADVDASAIYYYNPCYAEALNVGLTYTKTWLNWKYNPFFTQKEYDMISINLGGITKRVEDWTWRAQVSINFDNIEYWNFTDYMNYDFLLWGRYDLCRTIGVHMGFVGLTGMKIDRLYPIVGIDWKPNCHWELNLVFPMDLSAIYNFNKSWSVAVAGRFFNQRHRVKDHQNYSEGLWYYTTSGAEVALRYHPCKLINAEIHIGENFGGHIKVADRHYRNGHRLRLESAPYAGGELSVNF